MSKIWDAWLEVDLDSGTDKFRRDLARLPIEDQHVVCVAWCDSEVNNGGFLQFFLNGTGILAPEAVEGYRAVGRDDLADLVVEAMSRVATPYPRDRDERNRVLEGAWFDASPFDDLDTRYYNLIEATGDRPSLSTTLDRYTGTEPTTP